MDTRPSTAFDTSRWRPHNPHAPPAADSSLANLRYNGKAFIPVRAATAGIRHAPLPAQTARLHSSHGRTGRMQEQKEQQSYHQQNIQHFTQSKQSHIPSSDSVRHTLRTLLDTVDEVKLKNSHLSTHHTSLQQLLHVLNALGSALGLEGEQLMERVTSILTPALFNIEQSPALFTGSVAAALLQHKQSNVQALTALREKRNSDLAMIATLHTQLDEKQTLLEGSQNELAKYRAAELQENKWTRMLREKQQQEEESNSGATRVMSTLTGRTKSIQDNDGYISREAHYHQIHLLSKELLNMESLHARIEELKNDLFKLDVEKHQLQKENAGLHKEIEDMNAAMYEKQKKSDLLQSPNQAASATSTALNRKRALEHSEEFKNVWIKYQDALDKIEVLSSQLKSTTIICNTYRSRFQKSAQQEKQYQEQIESLQKQIDSMKQEFQEQLRPLTPRPDWQQLDIEAEESGVLVQSASQESDGSVPPSLQRHASMHDAIFQVEPLQADSNAVSKESDSAAENDNAARTNGNVATDKTEEYKSSFFPKPPALTPDQTFASAFAEIKQKQAEAEDALHRHGHVPAAASSPTNTQQTQQSDTSNAASATQTANEEFIRHKRTVPDSAGPASGSAHYFIDHSTGQRLPSMQAVLLLLQRLRAAEDEKYDILHKARHAITVLKEQLSEVKGKLAFAELYASDKLNEDGGSSGEVKNKAKWFRALGTSLDVPLYLRTTQKIRNRNLPKGETEKLVKDIWSARSTYLNTNPAKILTMDDFLYHYLKQKHASPSVLIEWGYNFLDALDRYKYDADCELFLKILKGQFNEAVYHDQNAMLDKLKSLFVALDHHLHPKHHTGKIPKDMIFYTLKNLFPLKSQEDLIVLGKAINSDQPNRKLVTYMKLFEENADGDQGAFMEKIRDTHLSEIEEFMLSLQDAISKIVPITEQEKRSNNNSTVDVPSATATSQSRPSSAAAHAHSTYVTIYDIHETWRALDPDRSALEIDQFCCIALDRERVSWETHVEPVKFCQSLFRKCLVKRKKNYDAAAAIWVPPTHSHLSAADEAFVDELTLLPVELQEKKKETATVNIHPQLAAATANQSNSAGNNGSNSDHKRAIHARKASTFARGSLAVNTNNNGASVATSRRSSVMPAHPITTPPMRPRKSIMLHHRQSTWMSGPTSTNLVSPPMSPQSHK